MNMTIGKRLRHYRKKRGLTLDELAKIVYKSRSTISKYENGMISISIDMLYDIADALRINVLQLIEPRLPSMPRNAVADLDTILFGSEGVFVYCPNRGKKRVIKCYLYQPILDDELQSKVYFYTDIIEDGDFSIFRDLYVGESFAHGNIIRFELDHEHNPLGHIELTFIKPFSTDSIIIGRASGITDIPHLPLSFKVVASRTPISDISLVEKMLRFSKEELQHIRKDSFLIVNPIATIEEK